MSKIFYKSNHCHRHISKMFYLLDCIRKFRRHESYCISDLHGKYAGTPVDTAGKLFPLSNVSAEQLVHDRRFKNPELVHTSPKCVFFGYTQTDCICGEPKILAYRRNRAVPAKCVANYYKVHLDTGAWQTGVLGCFCLDTCKVVYVKLRTSASYHIGV